MLDEEEHEAIPFTVKGECPDEAEFRFTDDKKLYVSKGILIYCSPVFKKMFSPKFKEGATGIVNMETKNYDDVLEFLRILTPGQQKRVTDENMFVVLELAEEYQVQHLIDSCKQQMLDTMSRINNSCPIYGQSVHCIGKQATSLKMLFDILSRCLLFSYSGIQTDCLKIISQFGSMIFRNSDPRCSCHGSYSNKKECPKTSADSIKSVKAAFNGFEKDLQIEILNNRLQRIDDNTVRYDVKYIDGSP